MCFKLIYTLALCDSVCDLGIMFEKYLKFDKHIDNIVNKVDRMKEIYIYGQEPVSNLIQVFGEITP